MHDPRDKERARWKSLNAGILRCKRLAYEKRCVMYLVKHGRWAYRVVDRLPARQENLKFWSDRGD